MDQAVAEEKSEAKTESVEDKAARLERELGTVSRKIETSQRQQPQLDQILADPDVQALLIAKGRGEQVKVVSASQQVEPEEVVKWDELTPQEQVAKFKDIQSKESKRAAAEATKPLRDEVTQIKQVLETHRRAAAEEAKRELRKQFPDAEQLEPQMNEELNRLMQGQVTPHDLYLLARHKAGKSAPAEQRRATESERPSQSAARPVQREERPQGTIVPRDPHAALRAVNDEAFRQVAPPTFRR